MSQNQPSSQGRSSNGTPVKPGPTTATPARSGAVASAAKPAVRRPAGPTVQRERRKLGPVLRLINAVMTFLVVAGLAGGAGLYYLQSGLDADGPLEQAKLVVVPKNDGTLSIAERLEREGVISNRHTFLLSYYMQSRYAAWNNGKQMQLKAGDYEFKPQASLRKVIDTVSEGRAALMKVTIPEGLTSYQIVERLRADQNLTGDLRDIPPEGSLLPETYVLPRGTTRVAAIDAMMTAQKKLIEQMWAERQEGLPVKSLAEALVLASVIEKETGRNDERDRVAAVFVNRLRQNMKLQSDPTILYGLALGRVSWGKPIMKSEILSPTAHNTYVIPGLPPTPICNPGRAAIEATLKPAQTKELYFVADGKGGHVFAETLKDHNQNVARYRQFEREAAAQKSAAGAAAPSSAPVPVAPTKTLNAAPAPAPAVPKSAATAQPKKN